MFYLLEKAGEQAFLNHTTLSTIKEELEDVRTDVRYIVSLEETKFNDIRGQAEVLHSFYTCLLQDPLSGSLMPTICSGWKALDALDLSERRISLELRAQ